VTDKKEGGQRSGSVEGLDDTIAILRSKYICEKSGGRFGNSPHERGIENSELGLHIGEQREGDFDARW